jgi:phage tail sheath protein FI
MPQYLSPGVYTEEVPSAIKPIAGVSTSTAGFIGIVPDQLRVPPTLAKTKSIPKEQVNSSTRAYDLDDYPVVTTPGSYQVRVNSQKTNAAIIKSTNDKSQVVFPVPAQGSTIKVSYKYTDAQGVVQTVKDEVIPTAKVDGAAGTFDLANINVVTDAGSYSAKVNDAPAAATLQNPTTAGAKGQVTINPPPNGVAMDVDYTVGPKVNVVLAASWDGTTKVFNLTDYPVVADQTFKVSIGSAQIPGATVKNTTDANGNPVAQAVLPDNATGTTGQPVSAEYITFQIFSPTPAADQSAPAQGSPVFQGATLCTNFTEYTNAFGDFSLDAGHRQLTHAVYGFFNNGGTRCYVVRLTDEANMDKALAAFELVDEIAIVAAPGLGLSTTNPGTRDKIVAHCKNMGDRFAVLDGPAVETDLAKLTKIAANGGEMPSATDYAAWYFPWVKVFDAVAKKYQTSDYPDGVISVPPSGHVAGIYARVDNARGVHKAPANEVVTGALDVTQRLSKAHQDGLNPKGVNCIRVLNDNILVWGARTVGGDDNLDLKYINVRRTLLFIRKSIDEGTQWVVFEPNDAGLWQKITRNVTAFLTGVWRSGALFGTTPQEAFYVKCDKETNPPDSINEGKVVTEIGVAIVRPAEFVIFRISQWAGTGS